VLFRSVILTILINPPVAYAFIVATADTTVHFGVPVK